jgi:hypothetical protein
MGYSSFWHRIFTLFSECVIMIIEWIVAGFFTYFGWWGGAKVIDRYVEDPKPVQAICLPKKEEQCGVKDK